MIRWTGLAPTQVFYSLDVTVTYSTRSAIKLISSPTHSEGLRYRGTSLIRNNAPLGPCSRTMPRALW